MRPNDAPSCRPSSCLALLTPGVRADEKTLLEQPPSEYKARRQALMERIKEADAGAVLVRPRGGDGAAEGARRPSGPVVVLVGETEEPEDGRYRQHNDFAYLTGVETPHAALILWPAEGKEVLYLPPRDKREEAWTGPRSAPGPRASRHGVRQGRAVLRLPRRPLRRHRRHRQASSPSARRRSSCSPPTPGPAPAARRPRWRGS